MSDKLLAGHAPFSTYQRSTAELIVALLWDLTFALAMSLETATRGTMIAAMMPRIVTRAFFSLQLKARGRTEPANADAFMVFHAQIHMFGNAPSGCIDFAGGAIHRATNQAFTRNQMSRKYKYDLLN